MCSEATSAEQAPLPYSSFGTGMKRYIMFTAAGAGFFSSLSAQIYFPALETIAEELNVTASLINLTVTSYMVFQGIAPIFLGSFADRTGRRPVYIICLVIYLASNVGLALQNNYGALLVLRCMQSSGISSSVALSAATVADISTKSERGSMMGIVMAGNFVGPAIGPIIGGLLAQYLGWRSIFWFLTIASSIYLVPLLLFFPETARNVVGDGTKPAQPWNRPLIQYAFRQENMCGSSSPKGTKETCPVRSNDSGVDVKSQRSLSFPNPLKSLAVVRHLNSIIILIITGVIMGANMTVLSSITEVYSSQYHLNTLQVGLCYMTLGTGSIMASVTTGRMLDWNYRRTLMKTSRSPVTDEQHFDEPVSIQRARCVITIPLVILGSAAVLAFGWVLSCSAALVAPEILLFFVGVGQTGGFISTSTLLVDLHPKQPAAATAANNMVRSLFSAGASAAIVPMLNSPLGRGWSFTLVAFVLLGTVPLLVILCGAGISKKIFEEDNPLA